MRRNAPALLPVFRSQAQADILATLLLHPGDEHTLTELAKGTETSLPTVHREINKLVESGLLLDRQQGRNRLVKANPGHPAADALTRLVEMSFGPRLVVAEEFAELDAERVLVFGSWAARYLGETGPTPHDVDVLVVGDTPRADMYAAADAAQNRLKLPVNPVLRTSRQWNYGDDKLITQIRSSPYLTVLEREWNTSTSPRTFPSPKPNKPPPTPAK
jgi:DNA-binding transcriptional ArsR family regulator